ncbi:hypothetical protein K8I28_13595 [bacterium]|nr:hypothetical protein [bacterium]
MANSGSHPSTINTLGQVPGLSVRDIVRLLSFQLRGVAQPIEMGYSVTIRNYQNDVFTRIKIKRSQNLPNATNLHVESGSIQKKTVSAETQFLDIEHLYITWDTPGLVSFCYADSGRFTLVNVNYERGYSVVNSMDKREEERDQGDVLDEDDFPLLNPHRRTFYHIGSLMKKSKFKQGLASDTGDTLDDLLDAVEEEDE